MSNITNVDVMRAWADLQQYAQTPCTSEVSPDRLAAVMSYLADRALINLLAAGLSNMGTVSHAALALPPHVQSLADKVSAIGAVAKLQPASKG